VPCDRDAARAPYVLDQDLVVLAIAIAFFARHRRRDRRGLVELLISY
jgi:hypothetical protein